MNIYKFNLNLLKAFHALTETANVSKAAKKLFITQPAMSNLLRQLRIILQDEILIRNGKAMRVTATAQALKPLVHQWLMECEQQFLTTRLFDPKTSHRIFKIGMNDYIQFVLLHKLINRLNTYAPFIAIKVIPLNNVEHIGHYINNDIDLAIGSVDELNVELKYKKLFTDSAICIARKNHPLFNDKKLSLTKYLQAHHLAITHHTNNASLTDIALNDIKQKRKISVSVPYILPSLNTIQQTDLIGTVPNLVAITAQKYYNLSTAKPPLTIPKIEVKAIWHKAYDKDLGLKWLVEQLMIICE